MLCIPNEKPKGILVGSWEHLIEMIYEGVPEGVDRSYGTTGLTDDGMRCVYRTEAWQNQPQNIYYTGRFSWSFSTPNTHQGTMAFYKGDPVDEEDILLSMTDEDLNRLANKLEIRDYHLEPNRIAVMSEAELASRMTRATEPNVSDWGQAYAQVFRASEVEAPDMPFVIEERQPIRGTRIVFNPTTPTPVVPRGAVEVQTWYDEAVETGRDEQARELFRRLEMRRQLFGTPVSEGEEESEVTL